MSALEACNGAFFVVFLAGSTEPAQHLDKVAVLRMNYS